MVTDPKSLVVTMDAGGIATVVNLDGMWGEEVTATVERYDLAYPGRFFTFGQPDWALLAEPYGVRTLLRSLAESHERGARAVGPEEPRAGRARRGRFADPPGRRPRGGDVDVRVVVPGG